MSNPEKLPQNRHNNGQNAIKKQGLLLVNLGTPEELNRKSVRKFLAEFLGDPRVVNLPRLLWLSILYLLILPFRSSKTLEIYRQVWMPEGSPLRFYSQQLADKTGLRLPQHQVELGMRYGEPSIKRALDSFSSNGIEQVTVLPLYPQFSSTTSASVFDAVVDYYRPKYDIPKLNLIRDYYQHPGWQQAVADSITDWQAKHGQPDLLIFSFHGLPQLLDQRGDPYRQHSEATVAAIVERLGLKSEQYKLFYQSRFGKAAWLQPYLEPGLEKLAAEGVRRVQIICPCFAVDGIETLEEIAIRAKETFLEAGGGVLEYIPALNDSGAHADAIADILS